MAVSLPPREVSERFDQAEAGEIDAFIERGMRSMLEARRTGDYVDAEAVLESLQRKLDAAVRQVLRK